MTEANGNGKTIYLKGEYLANNPSWHVQDSPWKAAQITNLINKHKLELNSVAEVGCGVGEILNQMYQLLPDNIKFFGFEVSPDAYLMAQERKKERLEFFLDDITERYVDELFDLLLVIDVFEHVEDYMGFLRKLRSKSTLFIFHIPLDNTVSSILRGKSMIHARKKLGHLHYFTKETALATLEDTGYKVIDYLYTAGSIELPTKSLKRKIMRLPRKLGFQLHRDLTVKVLGGYSLLVLAK